MMKAILIFLVGASLIADTLLMLLSNRYVNWWRNNVWNRTANPVDAFLFPGKQREYVARYIASFQFGFLGLLLVAVAIFLAARG